MFKPIAKSTIIATKSKFITHTLLLFEDSIPSHNFMVVEPRLEKSSFCIFFPYFDAGTWTCFDSLHVYKNQEQLRDNYDKDVDTGKIGLHNFRYGACDAKGCGPNYCCCTILMQ